MSANASKSYSLFHRFLGALLIVHVLLIAAMAGSPHLHEWVHADADHAVHECAVTLFASGSCESAAPVVFVVAFFALLVAFVAVASEDVTSFFLSCRIFERGPPALA